MVSTDQSNKRMRRYGLSCMACRKKKIKCDGQKPSCHNCSIRGGDCSYSPRRAHGSSSSHTDHATRSAVDEGRHTSVRSASDTTSPTTVCPHSEHLPGHIPSLDVWAEVGIDGDGSFSFHGPTSRFHTTLDNSTRVTRTGLKLRSKEGQINELEANAKLLRNLWQPLSAPRMPPVDDIPATMTAKLLAIYWEWQHPLHNCVYKPYFIRDMALGGPYFSEFLLMSIFALAGRHSSLEENESILVERGERFMKKAKLLLLEEMSSLRPRIPTIQALLVLGGRQCAVGKISEGWLYTGMAIRMMRDIGLHLSPNQLHDYEDLDTGELEARKRLYLSAYVWDKTISITLGRPPTLTNIPAGVDDILDFTEDSTVWKPVMIAGSEVAYPTVASFATSAFKEFCRLGEIITQVYTHVYTQAHHFDFLKMTEHLETKLKMWYDSIPDHLKMTELQQLTFCPPPHIFSLNLLYHTVLILIYRPFFGHPQGRQKCIDASIVIDQYLHLYMRTFNFTLMTYLVSYCVYTSAMISVMEIKSIEDTDPTDVANRLNTSLTVLEHEVRQTPGMQRSVDIIKKQLRSSYPRRSPPPVYHRRIPRTMDEHTGSGTSSLTDNQFTDIQYPKPSTFTENLAEDVGLSSDWDFWDIAGGFQPDVCGWAAEDNG